MQHFVNVKSLIPIIRSQDTSLQAYLLLDLQHQVAKMETKFFAFGREQTLKHYNDITRTMLLKLLESKHFVPLSGYSSKKIQRLSNLRLNNSTIMNMFRRLQTEAHQVRVVTNTLKSNWLCLIFKDSV